MLLRVKQDQGPGARSIAALGPAEALCYSCPGPDRSHETPRGRGDSREGLRSQATHPLVTARIYDKWLAEDRDFVICCTAVQTSQDEGQTDPDVTTSARRAASLH